MGNYVSCALTTAHQRSSGIQIVLPNADVRHVGSASAADLMLDFPGYFVASSGSLRIGGRFGALPADEDLEPGHVYVMIPMHRLNSTVSAADMGPLLLAAGKAVRRASGGSARVLPELVAVAAPPVEPVRPRLKLDDSVIEELGDVELRGRLSWCRSRRPRLETINEETSVC